MPPINPTRPQPPVSPPSSKGHVDGMHEPTTLDSHSLPATPPNSPEATNQKVGNLGLHNIIGNPIPIRPATLAEMLSRACRRVATFFESFFSAKTNESSTHVPSTKLITTNIDRTLDGWKDNHLTFDEKNNQIDHVIAEVDRLKQLQGGLTPAIANKILDYQDVLSAFVLEGYSLVEQLSPEQATKFLACADLLSDCKNVIDEEKLGKIEGLSDELEALTSEVQQSIVGGGVAAVMASPPRFLVPELPPTGIPNLDVSCYMNASIQAMFAYPSIVAKINQQPIVALNALKSPEEFNLRANDAVFALNNLLVAFQTKQTPEVISRLSEKLFDAVTSFDASQVQNLGDQLKVAIKKDENPANKEACRQAKNVLTDAVAIVQREKIRLALVALIDAQNDPKYIGNVGALIPLLRHLRQVIFNSKELSMELNRKEEITWQHDSAAVFETILGSVLHFQHQVQKQFSSIDGKYTSIVPDVETLIQIGFKPGVSKVRDLVAARLSSLQNTPWKPTNGPEQAVFLESTKVLGDLDGVVALQFKRFEYSDGILSKNKHELDFSDGDSIEIAKIVNGAEEKGVYELTSFVQHLDSEDMLKKYRFQVDEPAVKNKISLARGHYISYVKKGDEWYCCDDEAVYPVTQEELAEAKKQAYIAIFKAV